MTRYVFGYGSLIFAPEVPEAVREMVPCRLSGTRRSFNKISSSRLCPREHSIAAFDHGAPGFERDGGFVSLVLGTTPEAGAEMVGMAIGYDPSAWHEVLEKTDLREGYRSGRDPLLNGYERVTAALTRLDTGGTLASEVYLTNPRPGSAFHVEGTVSLETRAQIILNGTPRPEHCGPPAVESRGLHYLERTRAGLAGIGIVDPDLEAIAAAALALDGPWRALMRARSHGLSSSL